MEETVRNFKIYEELKQLHPPKIGPNESDAREVHEMYKNRRWKREGGTQESADALGQITHVERRHPSGAGLIPIAALDQPSSPQLLQNGPSQLLQIGPPEIKRDPPVEEVVETEETIEEIIEEEEVEIVE
jgi:hypothetical protein